MARECFPTRRRCRPGKDSLDTLMPHYYAELRRLAHACLAAERPDHTLQPTALVHETYLRFAARHNIDWSCRAQVLALASTMIAASWSTTP